MFSWPTAAFDKLLDKATSHLLLEPDWPSILQICDCIRQGDVQPKYAISAIKKRLYTRNPHVTLFALQVLESCVKNCGSPVHNEIATKQFMEELRDLVKANTNEAVRDKVLELIQAWAHAFRNDPNYRAVQDTLNLMKVEGYKFAQLKESDAMFVADQAPDWADGECCHRCRVQFGLVQRKHHCRNCGQIFCQKCSSQSAPIPRYGIEKEVRVCEACFEKLSSASKSPRASQKASERSSPSQQSTPTTTQPAGKSEQDLQEEEELQLALALSKSEVESKSRPKSWQPAPNNSGTVADSASEKPSTEPKAEGPAAETDPELAHYLNRAYWEQRQQGQESPGGGGQAIGSNRQSPVPSAPATTAPYSPKFPEKGSSEGGEGDTELEEFEGQLRSTLEVFTNRLQSNALRGRHVANDSYVQSLFLSLSGMHSRLLHYIQELDRRREHCEGLQDKLSQIRDARAALDALREEHSEQMRRQAEEAERQRQIQMAHKLQIMRQQKREYLQYQHQLALQKMQEQEREMQMRQEMHKQQFYMGYGVAPPGPPQGVPPQSVPPHSLPSQAPLPQALPPHSLPPQVMPPQVVPQHLPPQAQLPPQAHPQQGMPPQPLPPQMMMQQGLPPQPHPQGAVQAGHPVTMQQPPYGAATYGGSHPGVALFPAEFHPYFVPGMMGGPPSRGPQAELPGVPVEQHQVPVAPPPEPALISFD